MSRTTTITGAWRTLADACGGPVKLAAELGVGYPSVWRWATGGPVSRPYQQLVRQVAKRRRVPSPV